MRSTLEGLLESIERYDFGLFIFTPDDRITSRGVSENTARDNVILELGMFLGQLGRDRAFAVITEGTNPADRVKEISDLKGITMPRLATSADAPKASVARAAKPIRDKIREHGRRTRRIPLIRKWKFKLHRGKFSAKIGPAALNVVRRVYPAGQIVVVCRWQNEKIDTWDDPQVVVSDVRRIPPESSTTDIVIEVVSEKILGDGDRGDIVEAYAVLIPEGVVLSKRMTLGQMVACGCDVVDVVAVSAESGSARRL